MDERFAADLALLKEDASIFWTRLGTALDGVAPLDIPLHDELYDVAEELGRLSVKLIVIAAEIKARLGTARPFA